MKDLTNGPIKQEAMLKREADLHSSIIGLIGKWEEEHGLWVTNVSYHKSKSLESLSCSICIELGVP